MGNCRWTVRLEDGEHTVELEHGYWSGKRQIAVDGHVTHSAGGFFLKVWAVGSRDVITLYGHTCEVVVRPNFRTNNYDYSLIVDDQLITPSVDSPAYQEELVRRDERQQALEAIVEKAVNQTLQLVGGSVPRVFDHWFYGAMGIHPRHLVVWYIFEKDADLSAAGAGGLTDRLDRLTRQQLRASGYPGVVLEEIMVSFCSDEDVQRTTGGNYWHYFK